MTPKARATERSHSTFGANHFCHSRMYNSLAFVYREKVSWNCVRAYDFVMRNLLDVLGLTVELPTAAGWVRPVNEVSLRIGAGEALGLVGESGSGKTMLSLALMGLLPAGARVSGEAWIGNGGEEVKDQGARGVDGGSANGRKNLTKLNEADWQQLRGREIAMVFQEPMTSLNPVMRAGAQVEEAIRAHDPRMRADGVRARALEALRLAAVPEPEVRAEQFPHQLSGGLRQRVMIAMAIAAGLNGVEKKANASAKEEIGERPGAHSRLLIADEPTAALDVTVQKQVLELLDRLRRELGLGLMFITHDLGVVAQVADRVAVMYAGRIVEEGPAKEVLATPRHPYTQGLLKASPSLERGELVPIPGSVPRLNALPPGCSFEPRCALRRAECVTAVPALRTASANHAARCILV
jgi:oligopeptide/dipeptide ABC transporter ATP-binding protein